MANVLNSTDSRAFGDPFHRQLKDFPCHCTARFAFLLVMWAMAVAPFQAQQKPKAKLLFLVAREQISDPFFEKSVVLMLPTQEGPLIVGLVINKPTKLPLLKIFPESPVLKNSSDTAFMGGPVDLGTPALVFHSTNPPRDAMPLYDDVYLSFDPELISRRLKDPKQSGDLRLFLGRAQWAPAQLQGEAMEGSWYNLRAEGNVILDHDCEHLWDRLHGRAKPALTTRNWLAQPSTAELRPGSIGILPLLAAAFTGSGVPRHTQNEN